MADELFVACTLQTTPMAQEISSFSSSRSLPLKTQRFFGESVKQRELRIFIRIWNLQVQSFRRMSVSSSIYIHKTKIHVKGKVQTISVNKFCATAFPKLEYFKIKRVVNTHNYVVTPTDMMRLASRKLCLLALPDKNCLVPLVHHWWAHSTLTWVNIDSQSLTLATEKKTFQTITVVFQPFFSGGLR